MDSGIGDQAIVAVGVRAGKAGGVDGFFATAPGLELRVFEVHIINADGSGDIRLTNNTEEDRFPAWAPNMTIAFTRNGILFMMSPDGSEQTQLFDSGSFPAWRPPVGLTAPAVEPTTAPR